MQLRLLVLLILIPFFIFSQPPYHSNEKKPVPSLSIGDILPDLSFTNIANTTGQKIDLAVQGKPTLVVFFATWCSTCLKEAQNLTILKRKFGNDLRVVFVTYETKENYNAAQLKNKTWQSLPFPVIHSDTDLIKYFPYKQVPHNVWVNADRKILAITSAGEINDATIQMLVNNKDLALPLKKDIFDFEGSRPLLENGNGGKEENILFRSTFIKYLPGMNSLTGQKKWNSSIRYFFINQPLLALYAYTINDPYTRIVVETKNTTGFYIPSVLDYHWKSNHLFSYELSVPDSVSKHAARQIMLQDFNRYFNLYGRYEHREMDCLILKTIKNKKGKYRKTTASPVFKINEETPEIIMQNVPLARLVNAFNHYYPAKPAGPLLIDETGITHTWNMELKAGIDNPVQLNKELNKFGLEIIPTKRVLKVFVISPQND